MTNPLSKSRVVDTLVVGAGLAGLFAAALRAQAGKNVLIAEATGSVGGRWSPEKREGFQLGVGLSFGDMAAWEGAYRAIEVPFEVAAVENGNSVIYGTRGWQAAEDLPAWESYFTQPVTAMPKGGFAGFVDGVMQKNRFELSLEHPITELHVEDGRAVRAVAGSDQVIEFSECIWAADAKSLTEVLRGSSVPEAGTARIAWIKKFVLHTPSPGVVLEFAHNSRVSDFTETLVLPLPMAEGEEERRYVIGAFVSNRDASLAPEGKQVSSWIFQVPETVAEDNHEMMKRIRSARRTIEKCFPGFEKSIRFERVQVLPHTVTPAKKKKKGEVQLLPNLFAVADWAASDGAHFEGVVATVLGEPALSEARA